MTTTTPEDIIWDVVVVGGGPCGSTTAYFLAKQQINVLVIDEQTFPRDKICGDQLQPQVLVLLSEMALLHSILDEDMVKWSTHRGIVSPSGITFMGEIRERESLISVQRIVLDQKLIDAASKAGAVLMQNVKVNNAVFSYEGQNSQTRSFGQNNLTQDKLNGDGIWTLYLDRQVPDNGIKNTIRTRFLVCADGANSNMARNLQGLSPEDSPSTWIGRPNAIGCRSFAKGHTHNCLADEVIFYLDDMLPGGSLRISSELEDYLNITSFAALSDDYSIIQQPIYAIRQFERAISTDSWIHATLGSQCQLTTPKCAPMRTGGMARCSFPQGLIVGDAAGQQDPLTGDGLHYGMQAAKVAAEVLTESIRCGHFKLDAMRRYDQKCQKLFGWDFFWGKVMAALISKFPILVDAFAMTVQRQGLKAIVLWSGVKSGLKSKWEFILWLSRPDVAWTIGFYLIHLKLRRLGIL